MRILRHTVGLLALALAACSAQPAANTDRDIVVVHGPVTLARNDAVLVQHRESTAVPTTVAAPVTGEPRALTVEESARIHTTEMWSEPIAAN